MNKQIQDLKMLNKWIAKQLVKRSFKTIVRESKTCPFTGIITTNDVEKIMRYTEMPSFKDGSQRVWFVVLPDKHTISYSERKAKVWNTFTQSYEVNNLTQKAREIKIYLTKKAYAHYGIEWNDSMDVE
jgi:hypothetical protein